MRQGERFRKRVLRKNAVLRCTGRILLPLALAAVTAFYGGGMLNSHAEEAAGPKLVQYADLEALVKEFSPQVQMERAQFDSRLGRYESAREDIMETRRRLKEEADSLEKEGDNEGAESYRAQAKTLEKAAKDMDKQIRSVKGSTSSMALRQMEDTMIWTAQSLMGTYHSLKLEQVGAAAQAELKQSLYEKALRQFDTGGVSWRETEEAAQAAAASASRSQSLLDEMERVKGEMAMLLGFETGAEIELVSMPVPDSARTDDIKLEVDKWRALGNNYELRAERGASFRGTNKELHSRQRRIEQNEETMYAQIEALYQSVLSSRTAWNAAVSAMAAADAKWKADSRKMELGMLSNQEYLEARAAYLEAVAAKGQADVNFQQAMETYEWAVKGLIR